MRELSRDEVAALIGFGPLPHKLVRVVVFALLALGSLGSVFALCWATDDEAFMTVLPPLLGAELFVVFLLPVWLRRSRERFVVRNGSRTLARMVGYARVGSVGAYPASPILEITFELMSPEGSVIKATTLDTGHRDPRIDEGRIGREVWVYWHPLFGQMAVAEEPWRLSFRG